MAIPHNKLSLPERFVLASTGLQNGERPTFDQVTLLETMLMKDTPYFYPGLLDESKAYYNVMPKEKTFMETT